MELNLAVWRSVLQPPNLNSPIIFCNGDLGAQPLNLISANIPGYTVCWYYYVRSVFSWVDVFLEELLFSSKL